MSIGLFIIFILCQCFRAARWFCSLTTVDTSQCWSEVISQRPLFLSVDALLLTTEISFFLFVFL